MVIEILLIFIDKFEWEKLNFLEIIFQEIW